VDPIAAIVAGLAAGAVEAARPTAVQAIKDAYAGFKALIVRKFSRASTQVQNVEERPTSDARQGALKEELVDAHAETDPEVLRALQDLVATLRQHAPDSVLHLTANMSGGISVQGGTFQAPVTMDARSTTIQSGGGALVQASVNTGGGPFAGRDQFINNFTLHGVGTVSDLTAVGRAANPEPDALDGLALVLDEVSKLYQVIDMELTRYLSISLDDPQQVANDRHVLLSLDGGQVNARASEARGHCEKIQRIYSNRLHPWFRARLTPDALGRVEHAFGMLAASDWDMSCAIGGLASWLSRKASATLDLVDSGDLTGALRTVKDARLDCQPMRQDLAGSVRVMRDIQADLLRLAP
jgi:hypothetical protein